MSRRRRKKLPTEPVTVTVESLSHEGRGIAHVDGKTVFIEGALAGEEVSFRYSKKRRKLDEAYVVEIIKASPLRTTARCQHYAICGGCSLMHMREDEQIKHKQSVLLEQIQQLAGVSPREVLAPLVSERWGYRHKARLGVKHVAKKEKVLVGFREKRSSYIADIDSCEVLHPKVATLLPALQSLIAGLSVYNQLAQIEVAIAEQVTALILRHLQAFTSDDLQQLKDFENKNTVRFYLQAGGLNTIHPLNEPAPTLSYSINEENISLTFRPEDFTQVNFSLNKKMIALAVQLLQANDDDTILDLFCGLGNFTLPLARHAKQVFGLEGSEELIKRARLNAKNNGIENVQFAASDLMQDKIDMQFDLTAVNKLLLDPPRSGAQALLEQMSLETISTIVYVSCHPATLARDTDILVNESGYTVEKAGVMDMFPHTSHVESIVLFKR